MAVRTRRNCARENLTGLAICKRLSCFSVCERFSSFFCFVEPFLNSTWKPLITASACSGRWSHSHRINSWLVETDGATTASNPCHGFGLLRQMEPQPLHQFMASSDKWSHSRINSWLRLKTDGLYLVLTRPVF